MAQYKVPQDVEADDKLLGPFSFRQFVYLLIAGALIAIAVGLFQIFPLLALIPVPPILLFAALALPLKKDQPMETYLAAVASYYLKPRNRIWTPGQKESTIEITAPKIVENERVRDITGEEATHRLSFLADIVDTEGYAIKGMSSDHVNSELVAEAAEAHDMLEVGNTTNLTDAIQQEANERHAEVIREMKAEIAKDENMTMNSVPETNHATISNFTAEKKPVEEDSSVVVKPDMQMMDKSVEKADQNKEEKEETKSANPSIIELANNAEYSVATIAKEANRIKEREEGEVFISLH